MTTLIPREKYTPDELRQLYPETLQLQQVQVLMRHGERTPVKARFENAGLTPYWPYCDAARFLRGIIRSSDGSWDGLAYRRKVEGFNGSDDGAAIASSSAKGAQGICVDGELTDTGRKTTLNLGERLRRLYVDQLNFMPAIINNADDLYIRATPMPRALESVQQAFYGLYPPAARAPELKTIDIVTRHKEDETLYPNETVCTRFAQLQEAFAQRTADRWNESSDMAYLNNLLSKWMPEKSKTVKVDGHPRLSGIMDTTNATLAHGKETRLPKEFYDTKGRAITDKICVEEWFTGYTESREYRMLGIGALAGDVVARMIEKTRQPLSANNDIKFGLSGCHDTTLAALLSSLGAFKDEPWPPYTSHIAIELFQRRTSASPVLKTNKGWWTSLFGAAKTSASPSRTALTKLSETEKQGLEGWYVRLRYNDKVMTVPGCRPAGKHFGEDESLCTLAAFKGIVDKFTPPNWKGACRANLGKPAFSESVEPSGI